MSSNGTVHTAGSKPPPPRVGGGGGAGGPGGAGRGDDDIAIRVRDVSKFYPIYDKPRDRLKQAFLGKFRSYYRPFWALHHLSFDVKRGQAVGIVGRNGSGKSTLLQIIAGTLTPSGGTVEVRGRVAALLELGSGFNPEFTGRENVYLQGAILGIPRREIQARFDEIAAFADIGEFIDQPVKHYSSGMHARLAFSVAVSVDPDILIVDEVLAVGDMGFQQKCVARMRKLLDAGVTLLFVSHGADTVKSVCNHAVFLESGQMAAFGAAGEVVDRYIAQTRAITNEVAARQMTTLPDAVPLEGKKGSLRYGSGQAQVEDVRLLGDDGLPVSAYVFGETVTLEVTVRARSPIDRLDVTFGIRDSAGVDLMGSGTLGEGVWIPALQAGERTTVRFRFGNCLRSGNYGVFVTLTRVPETAEHFGLTLDHIDGVIAFQVIADPSKWVLHKFYQPVAVTVTGPQPAEAVVAAAAASGEARAGETVA